MRVLLTGAFGRVGTAVIEHIGSEHTFTYLDLDAKPDPALEMDAEIDAESDVVVADVADYESIRPAFDGQDAVVHLAAAPRVDDPWADVLESNIIGTHNVYRAAHEAGVERVIFASTNHVMGMYEREYEPELYGDDVDFRLDHTDPVRPDSDYGCSKVFGEGLGRYYVEREGPIDYLHALRICSVHPPAYDHPYGPAERGVDEGQWERDSEAYRRRVARQNAMWHSRRDLAQLVDCCLRSTEPGYDTFYGVSDNSRRWFDIEHARDAIGYEPLDSADEWTGPPT
ncbi:NAD-dependent epimerase/dehydratase family protein [Natrialba hulunbeirensis]|uniref:NAD-dependent epimerase/dehydratase family protein n=1 Tax=Natrialba hulunbeirensis TaxID=123783 RepID=UPI0006779747|nr:NAD(P)-dependent oxidoreductase [Natrialba hulunbeirensis]